MGGKTHWPKAMKSCLCRLLSFVSGLYPGKTIKNTMVTSIVKSCVYPITFLLVRLQDCLFLKLFHWHAHAYAHYKFTRITCPFTWCFFFFILNFIYRPPTCSSALIGLQKRPHVVRVSITTTVGSEFWGQSPLCSAAPTCRCTPVARDVFKAPLIISHDAHTHTHIHMPHARTHTYPTHTHPLFSLPFHSPTTFCCCCYICDWLITVICL